MYRYKRLSSTFTTSPQNFDPTFTYYGDHWNSFIMSSEQQNPRPTEPTSPYADSSWEINDDAKIQVFAKVVLAIEDADLAHKFKEAIKFTNISKSLRNRIIDLVVISNSQGRGWSSKNWPHHISARIGKLSTHYFIQCISSTSRTLSCGTKISASN